MQTYFTVYHLYGIKKKRTLLSRYQGNLIVMYETERHNEKKLLLFL